MNKLTHAQQVIAANARLPYVAAIKERDARIAELEAALRDCVRYINKESDMTGVEAIAAFDVARAALAKS